MSNNKKICIFNKNHLLGNKTLENHYIKSHAKEYSDIMKNGWFCRKREFKLFKNQIEMNKHVDKCDICKLILGENKIKENNKNRGNPENNVSSEIGESDNSESGKTEDDEDPNIMNDISFAGMEVIKQKLPKDKKDIKFPTFDFDKYKIHDDKITNSDLKLINSLIEEERNLF